MKRRIFFAVTLICTSFLLSLNTRAAANDKIGIVIECESISKLLSDIAVVSRSLDLKLQAAKTEMALAKMLASPELAGVDSNKAFQACMIMDNPDPALANSGPQKPGESFVLIIPLTGNGATYLKSAGKCYGKSEKANSLTHFTLPAGEEPSGNPDLYVGIKDGKAFLGSKAENVELVMSQQANTAEWKSRLSSVPGTLKVAIDITAVAPAVEESIKKTSEMLKQMPTPPPQAMAPMANPAAILSAEGDVLVAIMKQLKSYVIGLGISGKALEINSIIAPDPASQLAGLTAKMGAPSSKYISAMPAGSFMSIAGTGLNILDIFIDPYSIMMGKLSEAAGPGGAKAGEQMKNIIQSMKGCFSGDYAVGVIQGATAKDLAVIQMSAVNDPVKFRKVALDGLAAANTMYSNLMTGTTLTIEKSRMSGGYEVIPYSISTKPPAGAMPQVAMPTPSLFQNLKAEMAIAGKDVIYTMGGNQATMDAAIARLKTGGAGVQTSKAFTTLCPKTPAKMTGMHSIELIRMLKSYLATLPNGEQMLMMIPDTNSGIAGYSTLKGADVLTVNRIGLDEMAGIKNGLPALGLLLMPAIMAGNAPKGPATHGGAEARCLNNLRMLEAAKEQCALERGLTPGAPVNQAWLTKYLLRGKMPTCPSGGTYMLNAVGKDPTCSAPGHVMK